VIDHPQVLAVCRTDPEGAARMICELFHELDLLKTEVATLKAENAFLRNECQLLRDECQSLRVENQALRAEVRELKEKAAKNSHNSSKPPSMMLGLLIYR
jgi:regulator of replication initiation timing